MVSITELNSLRPRPHYRDLPVSSYLANARTVIVLIAVRVRPLGDIQVFPMQREAGW